LHAEAHRFSKAEGPAGGVGAGATFGCGASAGFTAVPVPPQATSRATIVDTAKRKPSTVFMVGAS
jgi:hypothetical protein